ncbi:MAG: hypothetical protein CMH52_04450 [Myxococcales bacterium]|nr:hypothetical protein [Myxococcales bacterium]
MPWTKMNSTRVVWLLLFTACSGELADFSHIPDASVDMNLDRGDEGTSTTIWTCEIRDTMGDACIDTDNDCFVESCNGDIDQSLWQPFVDCNDQNADIFPDGSETCNQLDDDCDGSVDEDFALGDACDVCGQSGVLECDVNDSSRVACSTGRGQSGGQDMLLELCNQLDDDCDQKIDEDCLTPPIAHKITGVEICGRGVVLATENGLYRVDLDALDTEPIQIAEDVSVANIVCNDAHLLWVNRSDRLQPCETNPMLPQSCRGQVSYLDPDRIRRITGELAYGGLALNGDELYLHRRGSVIEETTIDRILLTNDSFEIESPLIVGSSDPAISLSANALFVRTWSSGSGPKIEMKQLDELNVTTINLGPSGAGRPIVSDRYAAWSFGQESRAIWFGQLTEGGQFDAFQLPIEGQRLEPIVFLQQMVLVQDIASSPGPVIAFDLMTGQETRFIESAIVDSIRVDQNEQVIVWLDTTDPYQFRVRRLESGN